MRNDPSDNGGLFVGRRPGTAPVHFRRLPERGSAARQRIDRHMAELLFAAITFLSLLCWGPIPIGCLWVGSQINYLTGSVSFGILLAFVALFALLFGTLRLMRELDQMWILVRRAAGYDQRSGVVGTHLRDHSRDLRGGVHDLVRPDPRARPDLRVRRRRRMSRVARVRARPRLRPPRGSRRRPRLRTPKPPHHGPARLLPPIRRRSPRRRSTASCARRPPSADAKR